ncbi:MAG: HipA domain-containing protein [Verrucomicrobia bacterium]|nr:HipA domain-containing protein [Verrucomicrobiota bacterium]
MNICPIAYIPCGDVRYSREGLRILDPRLTRLQDFPHDAAQQRREALLRTGRMSIAGVHPKLSTVLDVDEGLFCLVDQGGRFIIKPQHSDWPQLPENEGLTMRLASVAGLDVPVSGLVRCRDGSWSYFVKRFDRLGRGLKKALEDFAQLAGATRDTKYDSSMERVAKLIEQHCTFPMVEKERLFRLALFSFLVGNEDLHLKNFSVITNGPKVLLSPAYDLLSSTVAFLAMGKAADAIEELALPLAGKKRNLTRTDWVDYFGAERLRLTPKIIDKVLAELAGAIPRWRELIEISFLSERGKTLYQDLLTERAGRMGWPSKAG